MVVNFTVENQPDSVRTSVHWLMAGFRQVNNRQPAKSKSSAAFIKDQFAGVVRTAMRHDIAHALDESALDIALRRSVFPNSTNAAHFKFQIISDRRFQISDADY